MTPEQALFNLDKAATAYCHDVIRQQTTTDAVRNYNGLMESVRVLGELIKAADGKKERKGEE